MKFITLRDKTVATLFGHSFEFKAGVPLHVPPSCYEAVQAAGAVPEDELPVDDADLAAAPQGEAREALIIAAMKEMVLANDRDSFTAAGAPAAPALSAKLGFTVSGPERDTAWTKAQVSDD